MTPTITHVSLIEDHTDYRKTLQMAIRSQEDLRCNHSYSSIEACLSDAADSHVPSVILLDLGLPGIHGVDGIPKLKHQFPSVKILVLTVYDNKPVVMQALAAGADGYLLKTDGLEAIMRGIREVMNGGAPLNSHIAKMILSAFTIAPPKSPDVDLTDREREILVLLSRGMIKKEIASEMGLSYHTIDSHVRNIYGKLQVHNLSGAVVKAMQYGLV
jgi:DNA-binding NarL/FixJ family response regulator